MEYNLQNIRQLADKYFKGETSLAEEAALREYFSGCREIPADLEACRLLFGQSAGAAVERPRRNLRLNEKPAQWHLKNLIAAASGIAAILVAAICLTISLGPPKTGDIVCYVNGQKITDRRQAMEYTQEALDLINASLRKPAERLAVPVEKTETIERVNEMLNTLTEE